MSNYNVHTGQKLFKEALPKVVRTQWYTMAICALDEQTARNIHIIIHGSITSSCCFVALIGLKTEH